jgi:SAM-dependent methyltransferase
MSGRDVFEYNQFAWDKAVERDNPWTVPVGPEVIARARAGDVDVLLTPVKKVSRDWLPARWEGTRVLGLAASGGQQGPQFAAAGAAVTILDASAKQLGQDRLVCERERLAMRLVQGDMADLTTFADASFDYVFHPCSNCFVPDVRRVWREVARVLAPGGMLVAGFVSPFKYVFDPEEEARGTLKVRYSLPYSDVGSLTDAERTRYTNADAPLEFSHTLEDQIGGQLAAGLVMTGFFEDTWGGAELVDRYFPTFMATRAVKPPLERDRPA